jgi:signal recognition particle receptor subunit beta
LLGEKDLANVPLLIFANKQDLVQALEPDKVAVV